MKRIDPFGPGVAFPLAFILFYLPGYFVLKELDLGLTGQSDLIVSVTIGLVAFFLGLLNTKGLVFKKQVSFVYNVSAASSIFIIVGYSITLLIGIYIVAGNTDLIFGTRDFNNARTIIIQRVGAPLLYLFRLNAIFFLFSIIVLSDFKRKSIFILIAMFLLSILVAALSGYRSNVIIILASSIMVVNYVYRKINIKLLVVAFFAASVFFVSYGAYRNHGKLNVENSIQNLGVELSVPSFNTLRIINSGLNFRGRYIANSILTLLPGEQESMGKVLKEELGLTFSGGGFAPSIIGGFFLDFGLLGVGLGLYILGFISGSLYKMLLNRTSIIIIITYSYWITYLLFCIRGGFLSEIFPLLAFLTIAGFVLFLRLKFE